MSDRPPNLTDLCDGDPLARALANLRPVSAPIAMPALLFAAGQASREAAARRWRAACALASSLLVGTWVIGYAWFPQASPPIADVRTPESLQRDPQPPTSEPADQAELFASSGSVKVPDLWDSEEPAPVTGLSEYLVLRQNVMVAGLNGLPDPTPLPPRGSSFDFERSLHLPISVLASPYYTSVPTQSENKASSSNYGTSP